MGSELAPGDRLGEYTLEEPLGEGGFAEVWLARHHRWSSRLAAAKVIKDRAQADRLRAESDCLERLSHPGIARALGMDLDHDPPYLLVEYAPGETLRELLRREGRLPPARAFAVFSQLALALAHSHALGITHGDLKPENVLVDAQGRVKLTDFGLGRVRASEASLALSGELRTQDAAVAGTIPYMAPEQRDGQPADPACDVFALGILLHEMLTGKRPQPGDHPREHLTEAPAWLDVWEQLYTRRDRRLADARAVVAALGLREAAREAGPESTLPPAPRGRGPWSLEEVERAVCQESHLSLGELLHHRARPQQGALDRLWNWAEAQFLGDESQVAAARHLVWYLGSEVLDVPHRELAERYGTSVTQIRTGVRAAQARRGSYALWRGVVDRLAPLPPSFVKRARALEGGVSGRILAAAAGFLAALVALALAPVAAALWGGIAALLPLAVALFLAAQSASALSGRKRLRRFLDANLRQVPGPTRRERLARLALHEELKVGALARELLDELPPPAAGEVPAAAKPMASQPEAQEPATDDRALDLERRRRTLEAVRRAMAEAEAERAVELAPPPRSEALTEAGDASPADVRGSTAPAEAAAAEPEARAPTATEAAAAAPEPSAPEPSAPEPSAPEPSAPEPSAPEPSAPEGGRHDAEGTAAAGLPPRPPLDEVLRRLEEEKAAGARPEAAAERRRKLEA
ncbi:MAG: serine/threonine protein kinase [Planctomycetota bacterium]|nr:MAG: serine/threonine protein kinase [Planctomycetota bacterium]